MIIGIFDNEYVTCDLDDSLPVLRHKWKFELSGEEFKDNVQRVLEEYQTLRKPNADAIARMALDNFVEMRDKVGSKVFLWKKKTEHLLHDLMPGTLIPKYNLVSFTTVPYAEALRRGTRLDRVLRLLGLVAALLVAGVLVTLRFPAGWLLAGVMIAAWVAWDRWRVREDTRA